MELRSPSTIGRFRKAQRLAALAWFTTALRYASRLSSAAAPGQRGDGARRCARRLRHCRPRQPCRPPVAAPRDRRALRGRHRPQRRLRSGGRSARAPGTAHPVGPDPHGARGRPRRRPPRRRCGRRSRGEHDGTRRGARDCRMRAALRRVGQAARRGRPVEHGDVPGAEPAAWRGRRSGRAGERLDHRRRAAALHLCGDGHQPRRSTRRIAPRGGVGADGAAGLPGRTGPGRHPRRI